MKNYSKAELEALGWTIAASAHDDPEHPDLKWEVQCMLGMMGESEEKVTENFGRVITASMNQIYGESEEKVTGMAMVLANYLQNILDGEPVANMYFPEEDLYQWISPQQLDQFKKMYRNCVILAYNNALGYLYSQIGELYDLDAMLSGDTNDPTAKILHWIMTVLTAYNIAAPSTKHSQSLQDNFDMVIRKVTEMKNGATTLHDAPLKPEPNAWGGVVNSNKHKMLG